MEEVIYLYKPTREASFLKDFLKEFKGVLVTDFYSGYDSIQCPQQKCLVHLLRDLNDALLKNPFDEEIKWIVTEFCKVLKEIVYTTDGFGLKKRYLQKHKKYVKRFFKKLKKLNTKSEISNKIKKRLITYEKELFLFLDYDNIPWNNNNVEHAIKHFAHYRQKIKGSATENGLEAYLILLSIYKTCEYKGINFMDFLLSKEKDIDRYILKRKHKNNKPKYSKNNMEKSRPILNFLKFQCLNCNETFDYNAESLKVFSKTKLSYISPSSCPKCNINDKTKFKLIETPELAKLFQEYFDDKTKKQTLRRFKPGMLMEYSNIFGADKKINFSVLGKDYIVIDAYCVNPFCKCENVYLNFFEKNCENEISFPKFSFLVNYNLGEIEEAESISELKAYDILKEFKEGFFKQRHEELKKEVQPLILKKHKEKFIPTRKLGRNEPCHCGSGEKYKKCCLEEDIKKYGGRIRISASKNI